MLLWKWWFIIWNWFSYFVVWNSPRFSVGRSFPSFTPRKYKWRLLLGLSWSMNFWGHERRTSCASRGDENRTVVCLGEVRFVFLLLRVTIVAVISGPFACVFPRVWDWWSCRARHEGIWSSGGIAQLVLNLCIRCRRVVTTSPQLRTLPQRKGAVVRIEQEAGRLP